MRFLLLLLAATPAYAQSIPVPSGQPVELVERIEDPHGPMGLTLRYRLLSPAISRDGGSVDLETALADIDAICSDYVQIDVQSLDIAPAQIVIALMDRPVPFRQAAPEATQYFEAYRIEDGTCIWEGF